MRAQDSELISWAAAASTERDAEFPPLRQAQQGRIALLSSLGRFDSPLAVTERLLQPAADLFRGRIDLCATGDEKRGESEKRPCFLYVETSGNHYSCVLEMYHLAMNDGM